MKTGSIKLDGTIVKYSFLIDNEGNWIQFFYTIIPEKPEQISIQMQTIENAEKKLFETLKIGYETVAVKRFFSSDLINHYDELNNHKKRQNTDFFISLIEQPPVSSVKASLLGMCLNNIIPDSKCRKDNIFYFDTESGIKHIFIEHIIDPDIDKDSNSEKQTRAIFNLLGNKLSYFNTTIEDSVLRTWIYAPHIDADYPGIVKARNEVFKSINLTKNTHYIASTGIQGRSEMRFARVFMDVWSVTGIDKKKIRYIQAPEYLSPTDLYGVAFERATAVEMGNADYLFISGTASIDKNGEIVHPGDVVKQTERTLENITALLTAAGFSKQDLSKFIVYLRDFTDYNLVKSVVEKFYENLPAVYVNAPVCRPGWLVEIEGIAARIIK
ncbi:MAG: Rid family hydrolase [Cyanobacteriota bacterium]